MENAWNMAQGWSNAERVVTPVEKQYNLGFARIEQELSASVQTPEQVKRRRQFFKGLVHKQKSEAEDRLLFNNIEQLIEEELMEGPAVAIALKNHDPEGFYAHHILNAPDHVQRYLVYLDLQSEQDSVPQTLFENIGKLSDEAQKIVTHPGVREENKIRLARDAYLMCPDAITGLLEDKNEAVQDAAQKALKIWENCLTDEAWETIQTFLNGASTRRFCTMVLNNGHGF